MTAEPLELSRALIRCPSVTPIEAGALDTLESFLKEIGFSCHRVPLGGGENPVVDNLFARIGTEAPHFCFAGHMDVVPPGDVSEWTHGPFDADVADGLLWGRGACDMKTGIGCFAAAVADYIAAQPDGLKGSISLLITCDEEGPAIDGTVKVLDWMAQNGQVPDVCLVGEPTNPVELGDMIKIGRRGSMNGVITAYGVQGHTAYGHLAENPIPALIKRLGAITETQLDTGTDHFPATAAEITSIDVGNPASNVIPAKAHGAFNIRFNDLHTGASLSDWIREQCDTVDGRYDLEIVISGEAFLTPPGPFSTIISDAVAKVTGRTPVLDTAGGTSDARFIKNYCAVAEFGLINQTAHKTDEHVRVDDVYALKKIYEAILNGYFDEVTR